MISYTERLQNIKPDEFKHENEELQDKLQLYVRTFKQTVAKLISLESLTKRVLPAVNESANTLIQDILNSLEACLKPQIILDQILEASGGLSGSYKILETKFHDYINNESTTQGKILKGLLDRFQLLEDTAGHFVGHEINKRLELLTGRVASIELIEPEEFRKKLDKIDEYSATIKKTSNDLLSLSRESIISSYAEEFKKTGAKHTKIANIWILVIIIITCLIITSISVGLYDKAASISKTIITEEFSKEQIKTLGENKVDLILISQIISKVFLIALSIFLLLFVVKQYLINKNLDVVNRNKATALKSYYLFKESLKDDKDKSLNIIMAEVARMIYSDLHSGFIKENKDLKVNSGLGNLMSQIINQTSDIIK